MPKLLTFSLSARKKEETKHLPSISLEFIVSSSKPSRDDNGFAWMWDRMGLRLYEAGRF